MLLTRSEFFASIAATIAGALGIRRRPDRGVPLFVVREWDRHTTWYAWRDGGHTFYTSGCAPLQFHPHAFALTTERLITADGPFSDLNTRGWRPAGWTFIDRQPRTFA